MAGSLGTVWYDIEARDKTQEGLASAETNTAKSTAQIQKNAEAASKANRELRKETKSISQEFSQLGMGVAMLGATLSAAALQAKAFGIDLGGLEPIIGGVGIALGALGSSMAMLGPLTKAASVVLYGNLIPSIQAAVVATWAWVAANAALTLGVSLVVAGLVAWYLQSRKNADAAQRMKDAQKDLEGAASNTKSEIQKLTDKLKELEEVQNRLAGIPGDIAQADRDHKRSMLDLKDTQKDYSAAVDERERLERALTQTSRIAAETGLPEAEVRRQLKEQLVEAIDAERRAMLDAQDAQAREEEAMARLNELKAERVRLLQEENTALAEQPRLLSELSTAQQQAQLMPTWPAQQAGEAAKAAAAGEKQWAQGPAGTTTITLQNAYFNVNNGQTTSEVFAEWSKRNQRVQQGVRT